jgi:putative flippase GtrA
MVLSQLLQHRAVRFLLVSGVNTAFSFGIYVLLVYLGLNYAVANLLALIAGIFFSFKTQGRFVFDNRSPDLLFRYAFCWLIIYVCNILLIRQIMQSGINAYAAGAMCIPVIAVVSYFVQKRIVFKKKA